jgi:hypothetical protein
VRRGGDDFVETARALFGTVDGAIKRQPGNRWKWVSVKLKRGGRVRNEIERTQSVARRVPRALAAGLARPATI